jgi:hypothetical protein
MVHNTVVSTYPGGAFIVAHAATQSMRLVANLFAGNGDTRLLAGGMPGTRLSQQHTIIGAASQLPGASSVAAPNFWPRAPLRAQLELGGAVDPSYTQDAPHPFTMRAIGSGARLVGALQSSP